MGVGGGNSEVLEGGFDGWIVVDGAGWGAASGAAGTMAERSGSAMVVRDGDWRGPSPELDGPEQPAKLSASRAAAAAARR